MSDTEIDKEWQSNGRPQSTMARSFALALDDLFKLDSSVTDLDAVVSEKKKEISSRTTELEELEARLKATEERLKAQQAAGGSPPSNSTQPQTNPTSPIEANTREEVSGNNVAAAPRPLATKQDSSYSSTALASHMPGALPPTPGASEDGDVPPTGTE